MAAAASFAVGDAVRVKWGGAFYAATVAKIFSNGDYDVHFDVDQSVGRAKRTWVQPAATSTLTEATNKKKKEEEKTTRKKRGAATATAASPSTPTISMYERARMARIAQNQRELAALRTGMNAAAGALRASAAIKKRKRIAARATATTTRKKPRVKMAPRRSKRQRGAPVEYGKEKLDNFFDGNQFVMQKLEYKRKKRLSRKRRKQEAQPLTAEQRKNLDKFDMDAFEEFLLTVPHGRNGKPISAANARTTIRQVKLLVSGAGVNYHHWPEDFYFCKGYAVTLQDDLEELRQQANAIDRRGGRWKDLGNGWLLNHPLQKMQNFASYLYRKQQEARKAGGAK